MSKNTNVFAKFQNQEVLVGKVNTLDGAEVKYRRLTMLEQDTFQKKYIDGFNSDGKPNVNFDAMSDTKYERVSLCLIEPKMSVEDLKNLSSDATPAINEIDNLISGVSDLVDDEGN